MKFIQLTCADGYDIWVNPERIAWMGEDKHKGEIVTRADFDYGCILVKETPKDIIRTIRLAEEL